MFDSIIIMFLPFLLGFTGTMLLSNIFLSKFNDLKLQGTYSSRAKKKTIFKNAGSLVLFFGGSVSLCFIVVLGFVPPPMFLKVLLLGGVLVAIGFKTGGFVFTPKVLFFITLLFTIILVALLQPLYLKTLGVSGFIIGVVFSFGCVYILKFLNLLDRTAVLFSISVTLFGSVLGVYTDDVILSAGNFSVMGSLLAFSYFNFSESRKIDLGTTGELLIGLAIAAQGLYFFDKQATDYFNFIPFAFLIFLYPISDALQYFGTIAINKIFRIKIKVCQIHEHFSSTNMPKTNAKILLVFAFLQFFILAAILLNFGFM